MDSLEIIFAGSGAFGSPTLDALIQAGHKIVQLVTQPDRPAGRGKRLTPTPIAEHAARLGLEAVRTENINALPLPAADVMIVIAFGQKIGPAAVNHARLGAVNLHASRLPRHRGAAPIHWAVISGDPVTGNSIIWLAEKMDAGAVLARSELPIGPTDTTADLHDRLATDGAGLMLQTLAKLADRTAVETAQDESHATVAPKLSRQSALLDFSASAETVARRINGLSPWPGCRVRATSPDGAPGAVMTLLRARPLPARSTTPPGIVDDSGRVGTGAGSVELLTIQPDGKRPMPFDDFRRGYRWVAGTRVESVV